MDLERGDLYNRMSKNRTEDKTYLEMGATLVHHEHIFFKDWLKSHPIDTFVLGGVVMKPYDISYNQRHHNDELEIKFNQPSYKSDGIDDYEIPAPRNDEEFKIYFDEKGKFKKIESTIEKTGDVKGLEDFKGWIHKLLISVNADEETRVAVLNNIESNLFGHKPIRFDIPG